MAGRSDARKNLWDHDAAPGLLLLAATALSFALRNAPARDGFDALLHAPLAGGIDLAHVVSDGLMVVFFLYVGLELKRGLVEGPFRNVREAATPMIAALGGMAAPAAIYLAIAPGFARGWAIPAATDIAFAIGVLSLLGPRVPAALRLFLLALAIVDDVGAILVIAFFYTSGIVGWALGGAVLTFVAMLLMNRAGVRKLSFYWPLALALWAFTLMSGVHATIAGVLAAMAIPMRRPDGASPLIAAETALKPWVVLAILPAFALVSAGVALDGVGLSILIHPIALGAGLGLALGKPIGICGAALIGAALFKLKLPAPPLALLGVSMVAGIGFTMSLFIATLAFGEGAPAAPARLGVITGSTVSALAGLALLAVTLRRNRT